MSDAELDKINNHMKINSYRDFVVGNQITEEDKEQMTRFIRYSNLKYPV